MASSETYTHTTRLGEIMGLKIQLDNTTIYQFRKIPYAKPPLSSLRFEIPMSFGNFHGRLDATNYGPNCLQNLYQNDKRLIPNWELSEDCLHLNIFAPTDLKNTSNRAVMVWIHGGGFTNGQGMMFDGSRLAAKGNVIVVTINYRLNIFGFVNAGAGSSRNVGLLDQIFAIQWVQQNILDYGGNPNVITIFGESAGGVSVGLQSIIPRNKGLFQRTIAHSGSALLLRDMSDTELLTREIGRVLNCSQCQSEVAGCLNCLRNIPAPKLLQAFDEGSGNLHKKYSFKDAIGPIVDGDLIPESPIAMLSDPNSPSSRMFNSIDFIAGTNDCEAGLFYFGLMGVQETFKFDLKKGIPSRVICEHVVPTISNELLGGCEKVTKEICKQYSPVSNKVSLKRETEFAINFYGDLEFASLATQQLTFHTRSRKGSYQYLFTHKPLWGLIQDRPDWLLGANHADEMVFVFGLKEWYPKTVPITSHEEQLSAKMMTFWLNFAKTGNPNSDGSSEWQPFDKTSKSFIIFGEYRNSTVDCFNDRMEFWNEKIPKLVKECKTSSQNSNISSKWIISVVFLFYVIEISNIIF